MKIAKELAREAKRLGICREWHTELKTLEDKRAMVEMYVKGIDFCLANDYPSNDYIRANFKGMMEEYGIFLDDNVQLVNPERCVALGTVSADIEVSDFGVCEVYAKHTAHVTITAKGNAFVMIDAFDNSIVNVSASESAKVCVNRYGNALINAEKKDNAMIKIIEKQKKTY